MSKLSVCISTYNSEDKIENLLKSVKFADEIIVVNNSSTDKTAQIAEKYTDKIFTRPNNKMLNINKNFGFSKATGDWILCLDDDELIPEELKSEIEDVLQNDPKDADGFYIPRKNIIFGKWIEHTGWYPDPQLRFFRNGKGKFEEKHVHEMIKVDGNVSHLKEPMVHYNYTSVMQFLHKMDIYVPNEAEVLLAEGYKTNFSDAIKFPFNQFLTRFFAQEGYKDGFHGLMLSLLMAFYHFYIFAYIWDKQGFKDTDEDVFEKSAKEMESAGEELGYWIKNTKIKSTKNPLKKILYKTGFSK